MQDYYDFLQSKRIKFQSRGIDVDKSMVNPMLFPFQADLVAWALRKGRAAIFADTGLGKTFMQVEWARLVGVKTIIVAPLSVARQTVREAQKLGVQVYYVREQSQADSQPGNIFITNYEMIEKFDPYKFDAIVLDESSILKSLDGKTKQKLIDMFSQTNFRLCCTATPAPNDISEIANHSEFLGIMTRAEMLASFFVHDDTGWRLRGHASQAFYRWMASWGMSIKKPSNLGYDDDGFILPSLSVNPVIVETGYIPEGQLLFTGLEGIANRGEVRKSTIAPKAEKIQEIVNNSEEQWIVWCGLNDESNLLSKTLDDAIEVQGSDNLDYKIETLEKFQNGEIKVLVTKTKIAGFGMNFQNCHNMVFMGLSDSWEGYYQAVRRCWRFGQQHPVNVYIILGDVEQEILANIKEKEAQANKMSDELISNVQKYELEEIKNMVADEWEYKTDTVKGDGYTLMLGDSTERINEIKDNSIDMSVFSPPFMDLYTYSPTERDLGNSGNPTDFFTHFGFIIEGLLRITRPGRICAVHTADVPALLSKDGYIGLKDFPGMVINHFTERGWIYHGRVTIDKNPQAQAIRTHSKGLLFVQMEKDSTWSRPAVADYVLFFRKPGDNQTPVTPVENGEITREKWIEWAHPIWYGIRETDTLQYTTARDASDDKHICPLQLGTIERCIALYSNPGETVFTPFLGIGSEAYQAVKMKRKAVGIELKPSYFKIATQNLKNIRSASMDLFQAAGITV
jgi:superfamily II DNA or RNA helicase